MVDRRADARVTATWGFASGRGWFYTDTWVTAAIGAATGGSRESPWRLGIHCKHNSNNNSSSAEVPCRLLCCTVYWLNYTLPCTALYCSRVLHVSRSLEIFWMASNDTNFFSRYSMYTLKVWEAFPQLVSVIHEIVFCVRCSGANLIFCFCLKTTLELRYSWLLQHSPVYINGALFCAVYCIVL